MIDPNEDGVCECVKVEQDESCPVGYPSLLCDECDGVGYVAAKGWIKGLLERCSD